MAKKKDPLASYNAKRDFARTKEPAGEIAKDRGNRFIVQKHDATRLHYDFRLEVDGVLKSWAVTKGPSPDPADKRLAVRTEDHPLSYAEFEGSIPKGEYGGGTVMLWDRGTWKPIAGKSVKDLDKGHLHFKLQGERMKGEWLLVRMKGRPKEKRENWLLRKIDDGYAGASDELVARELTSIATGRSMAAIARDETGEQSLQGKRGKAFDQAMADTRSHLRAKAGKPPRRRKAVLPQFRKPQLATLVESVPTGNQWMHEIKFDGYRCQIAVAGDKVRVYTRSGKDWTDKFQNLADAIAALDLPACLIDGEVVALNKAGDPDFSALQKALKNGEGGALIYFAFDLIEENGEDWTPRSNIERKERLDELLDGAEDPIRVADHLIGAGEKLFAAMCDAGQEGIISKKADAAYRGARTSNWLKIKCTRRQEFVIVGWSESHVKVRPFASLLLAQHDDGGLRYKGKVGTGFDKELLGDIAAKLARIEHKTPPLDVPKAAARGVHWVTPRWVAEIAFAEFTADDRVRHASFLGLRLDKNADEVEPEIPSHAPQTFPSTIIISSRDRVIFPDAEATKGDLADYYAEIAPLMLPFTAHRPVSLVRCPQGRAKKCFFQKHDSGSFGDAVHHVPIAEKDGGHEDYLYIDHADGLLSCVQMGSIEFHIWAAHVRDVEAPDRMVFDLDPDEGLNFDHVVKAAEDIRNTLADIGLVSFAMLSGGKGVHVIVPLDTGHSWEAHKDFARRFSEALAQSEPDRFVATMSKAKRTGKIFIDWLRNQRGATAIAPYSARSRAGAPVAVPVLWDELTDFESAAAFTIADADTLIERTRTIGKWGIARQTLPDL